MRHLRGFSRLELAVSIGLVCLLAGGLLSAMLYYEELAESTAVRLTLLNLRSGMRYRMMELAIRQGREDFGTLLAENPLDWLARPPEIAGNRWQYEPQKRELIYRPRLHFYLRDRHGAPLRELRFRLTGVTAGPLTGQAPHVVQGVHIEPVVAYDWL